MKLRMQLTHYSLSSPRVLRKERVLFLADLHEQAREDMLALWQAAEPTLIVIAGDWLEAHSRSEARRRQTLDLTRALTALAPVYCSLGNHELGTRGNRLPSGERDVGRVLPPHTQDICAALTDCGVTVLDDRMVHCGSLYIGGLTSAGGARVSSDVLAELQAADGFRLLLCHHPEYYEPYVRDYALDLTLSGHAHGGQWRLLGQGLYAPGQGLLPRYTSGFYDGGHLLVSRGLAGRYAIPRIGNPKQSILIQLDPAAD